MFPIHFKLTIGTVAELQRLTAFLAGDTAQAVADCPKLPELTDTVTVDVKPAGKPKAEKAASAAKTAPTQPTAAVDPSPASAAHEGKTAATEPAAAATSAGQPGPFEYETLRKKVFELLPAHGGPALTKVAKKHGFENFKLMQAGGSPNVWQQAYNDLVAQFEAA